MKLLLLSLVCAFAYSSTSFAREHDGACKTDVEKFCKDVEKGKGRIARCLKEHQNELSESCQAKKEKVKEKMVNFRQACKEDIKSKCSETKRGQGRVLKCLKENNSTLSAECKQAIERKQE